MSIKSLLKPCLKAIGRSTIMTSALSMTTKTGLLPRAVWRRIPVERRFTVRVNETASFQYESIAGDGIGRRLFWKGLSAFEPETARLFIRLASKARSFIDVGANSGFYTLLACAASNKMLTASFEPLPLARERLQRNIALNEWNDRCSVYDCAVSNYSGSASFYVPNAQFPTSASLHTDGFKGYEGRVIECEAKRLDDLSFPFESIELAKIDVEGFEHHALEGMSARIGSDRPAMIIECLDDGPYQAIEQFMNGHDYCFYHITDKGPQPVGSIRPDSSERCKNFLFLPKERLLDDWL